MDLLSVEHAWSRLTTHLEWADRFWILFLFTDDPRVSDTLCRRAREQLDAQSTSFAQLHPSAPEGIDELIGELLEGTPATVSWVDLLRHDQSSEAQGWAKAWEDLMLRLNERRELLRRRSPTGGIVFVTTLERLGETPALAPDLWTIRALLLRVATLPADGERAAMPMEAWTSGRPRAVVREPKLARQAVDHARTRGDDRGLLATLLDLAEAETGEASLTVAREAQDLVQSLAEHEQADPKSELISALRRLGDVFGLGDYDAEAEACYRRGLELSDRVYETRAHQDIAATLAGLGRVLAHMAEYSRLRVSPLRTEALEFTRQAVDAYRALSHEQGDELDAELAGSLGQLAKHLSQAGQREQAWEASGEALKLLRVLAEQRPDAYTSKLAESLRSHGRHLSALRRRQDALKAMQESVEIYRGLVDEDSDQFLPDLAKCLINVGWELGEVGRTEEGLNAHRESLGIFRELMSLESAAFMPELAEVLGNIGVSLWRVGEHEDALEVTRESIGLYRDLVRRQPGKFTSSLASGVSNLGIYLIQVGHRDEAVETTRQAVAMWRGLNRGDPDSHAQLALAQSLVNYASALGEFEQWNAAVHAAEDAVELYRELKREQSDASMPGLATALYTAGAWLNQVGRWGEAVEATSEAVEFLRMLVGENAEAYRHELANALCNRGDSLSMLGRNEDAIETLTEAVKISRELATVRPTLFQTIIVRCFMTLGVANARMGQYLRASGAFAEGLESILPAFVERPAAHGRDAVHMAKNLRRLRDEQGVSIPDRLAPVVTQLLDLDQRDPPEWKSEDFEVPELFVSLSVQPPVKPAEFDEESALARQAPPLDQDTALVRGSAEHPLAYVLRTALLIAMIVIAALLMSTFG